MATRVVVFTGNEGVDAKSIHEIPVWSKQHVLELLKSLYDDWRDEKMTDMFDGPEVSVTTTLEENIPGQMFTGVHDVIDGGIIYVVQVVPKPVIRLFFEPETGNMMMSKHDIENPEFENNHVNIAEVGRGIINKHESALNIVGNVLEQAGMEVIRESA